MRLALGKAVYGVLAGFVLFVFLALLKAVNSPLRFWDESVYVGAGKYIYSFGSVGLWEPARPLMLPLLLGGFWRLGFDPLMAGIVLVVVLSAASVCLVYLLLKELTDRTTAIVVSLLFALNVTLVQYSGSVLVDIPAMALSLAAVWLAVRKLFLWAGVVAAIAMLTKFTAAFVAVAILGGLVFGREGKFAGLGRFGRGFFAVAVPYFTFNLVVFGNPFYPMLEGSRLIQSVAGNFACPTSQLFFFGYAVRYVPLLLVSVVGFAALLKKPDWKWVVVAGAAAFPVTYHSLLLNCKDVRYVFAFLPFLYALAGYVFYAALKQRRKWLRCAAVAAVSAQLIFSAVLAFGAVLTEQQRHDSNAEFAGYLGSVADVSGKVWSSTPEVLLTADVKVDEMVYYPVFDSAKAEELISKLDSSVQYVVLNTCDIPCVGDVVQCSLKRQQLLDRLNAEFDVVYVKDDGECDRKVYRRGLQE